MNGPQGRVEAIFLAKEQGGPPQEVSTVVAHPGRGLEGDRYFDDPEACDITLIEAEAIERMRADHGLDMRPEEARRQVIVRGVDLGEFIGRRFYVGEVECEGEERCEPCQHLAGLLETPVVLRGLLHSGLRAGILNRGTIRTGDAVKPAVVAPTEVEPAQ